MPISKSSDDGYMWTRQEGGTVYHLCSMLGEDRLYIRKCLWLPVCDVIPESLWAYNLGAAKNEDTWCVACAMFFKLHYGDLEDRPFHRGLGK